MKIFSKVLSLVIVASVGLLVGCGGGGGGTDPVQKVQLKKLSSTWKIQTASLNGNDRTSDFQGPDFALTLTGTFNSAAPTGPYQYSVAGKIPSPSPWDSGSGTWNFASVDPDGKGGTITREDGIVITYKFTDASGNNLKLSFNCNGCNFNAPARVKEVDGDWVFTLKNN